MKKLLTIILIMGWCSVVGQDFSDRGTLGQENVKRELDETLKSKKIHNVIDGQKEIIKDKERAVEIAEKFLFDIYGEKKIKEERPYEVYKFGKYWTIRGTLPKDWDGGTFLIILDATDSKVLRITHDK